MNSFKIHTVLILIIICNSLLAQSIQSFIFSECDQSCDYEKVVNRIAYKSFENNTLTIGFGNVSNCAGMYNPTIDMRGDTLLITYEDYVTEIDTLDHYEIVVNDTIIEEVYEIKHLGITYLCDCYFESEYVIEGIRANPSIVLLNNKLIGYYPEKYKVQPIEFKLVKGDTINLIDKFGFNQGLWIEEDSKNQLINKRFFQNDKIIWGTDFRYYENGKVKSKLEWENGEHISYDEYDSIGNVITHRKRSF